MPVASMWGSVAPMQSLMASMEVLQMVDRNTPKLIPANPGRGERIIGTFFSHDMMISPSPCIRVRTTSQGMGPWQGIWNTPYTVIRVMLA